MAHHPRYSHKLKPCHDQRFYHFMSQAKSFLTGAHLNYAVFGSVGVCAWLPYAPFIPKDMDVIVDAPSWYHLQTACWEWNVPLTQEKHYATVKFGNYALDLVPEHFRIFPWRSDEVVASYDLTLSKMEISERPVNLLPINETVILPVPRPEYLLVSSMRIVGFNTNTMQRVLQLLSAQKMDLNRLLDYLDNNSAIKERFWEIIERLEDMLAPHNHPAYEQVVLINQALTEHLTGHVE